MDELDEHEEIVARLAIDSEKMRESQPEVAESMDAAGFLIDRLAHENADLRKQLEQAGAGYKWQPMEKIPEHGRVVIFCDASRNRWTDCFPGDWRLNGCGRPPIGWQELPEPMNLKEAT